MPVCDAGLRWGIISGALEMEMHGMLGRRTSWPFPAVQAKQRGSSLLELNSGLVRKANTRVIHRLSARLIVLVRPTASIIAALAAAMSALTFLINTAFSVMAPAGSFMPTVPSLLAFTASFASAVLLSVPFIGSEPVKGRKILNKAVADLIAPVAGASIARYAAKTADVDYECKFGYSDRYNGSIRELAGDLYSPIPDPGTAEGLRSILEDMMSDRDGSVMRLEWHRSLLAALGRGLAPTSESWPLIMYVLDNSLSVDAKSLEPGMEEKFEEAYSKIVDVSDPRSFVYASTARDPYEALEDAVRAAEQGDNPKMDEWSMATLAQLQAARERLSKISGSTQPAVPAGAR